MTCASAAGSRDARDHHVSSPTRAGVPNLTRRSDLLMRRHSSFSYRSLPRVLLPVTLS